jgi:hypothetical protein
MLKMKFGMYRFDDFRGRIAGISELTGAFTGDEDTIFQRCESDGFGALFLLRAPQTAPAFLIPLRTFASFGVTGEVDSSSGEFAALTPRGWAYILATPHIGIGYDFEDTGFLRAQFIGSNYKWGHGDDWYNGGTYWFPSHVNESARLETAFNLTGVKDLMLDAGIAVPFAVTVMKTDTGTVMGVGPTLKELGVRTGNRQDNKIAAAEGDLYQPPMAVVIGAEYDLGDVGLRGRLKLNFGEHVAFDSGAPAFTGGFDIETGIEPSYKFSFGTVAADIAVKIKSNDTLASDETISHNGTFDLGLGAWFIREFGYGITFKCGIGANVPVLGDGYYWTPNGTKAQKQEKEAYMKSNQLITIPLILTVNLF